MRKKLFTLALAVLAVSLPAVSAQGLFQDDDLTVPADDAANAYNTDTPEMRAPGTTNPPDAGGPVGEGILILSALAGGYALVKKKTAKKESSL